MTGQGAEREKLIPAWKFWTELREADGGGVTLVAVSLIPACRGVISHSSCLVSKPEATTHPYPVPGPSFGTVSRSVVPCTGSRCSLVSWSRLANEFRPVSTSAPSRAVVIPVVLCDCCACCDSCARLPGLRRHGDTRDHGAGATSNPTSNDKSCSDDSPNNPGSCLVRSSLQICEAGTAPGFAVDGQASARLSEIGARHGWQGRALGQGINRENQRSVKIFPLRSRASSQGL